MWEAPISMTLPHSHLHVAMKPRVLPGLTAITVRWPALNPISGLNDMGIGYRLAIFVKTVLTVVFGVGNLRRNFLRFQQVIYPLLEHRVRFHYSQLLHSTVPHTPATKTASGRTTIQALAAIRASRCSWMT